MGNTTFPEGFDADVTPLRDLDHFRRALQRVPLLRIEEVTDSDGSVMLTVIDKTLDYDEDDEPEGIVFAFGPSGQLETAEPQGCTYACEVCK